MIANSDQLGPTESRSGNAQYRQPAAIIATKAGHRGSRTICLFMRSRMQARLTQTGAN